MTCSGLGHAARHAVVLLLLGEFGEETTNTSSRLLRRLNLLKNYLKILGAKFIVWIQQTSFTWLSSMDSKVGDKG